MFRNALQSGFLSILYSCGSSPLELWDMHVKNGYIRRIIDDEVKSLALEIAGTNVATTYIYCPADKKRTLAISLPFLVMIIKNMKRYFTFEITILDDKHMHRRFRVSNFQSTTRVRPFCTSMPIGLSGGWNQIQFNLADFTRRAYGTNYVETVRMQIHANCRVRRIYFASRLYSEDELPAEYKLLLPIHRKKCVRERDVAKKDTKVMGEPEILEERPSKEAAFLAQAEAAAAAEAAPSAPASSEDYMGEGEEYEGEYEEATAAEYPEDEYAEETEITEPAGEEEKDEAEEMEVEEVEMQA